MILATVGTQLPFPRLILALDALAERHGLAIVAQCLRRVARARHVDQRPHLSPAEFDRLAAEARLIVGHAGIGTILSAARHGKPIIIFPRRAALREHRNDHQLATARRLRGRAGIHVADDETALEALLTAPDLTASAHAEHEGLARLVEHVRRFVAAT